MSFIISINSAIDKAVLSYIENISTKYNIDKSELYTLWSNKPICSKSTDSTTISLDKDSLQKLIKNDLVNICKDKKIKHTGTKPEIIDRIIENSNKVEKPKSITEKIQTTLETIQIRRNAFGNYEHFETHIVFDKNDQTAIGIQNSNGKIDSLSQTDLEQCKKYKFKFNLPSNISKKNAQPLKNTDNSSNEDIDSDIEKEKDEEIVIENEEEEEEEEEDLELDDEIDDVEEVYESD
jgi:hypothetical protein